MMNGLALATTFTAKEKKRQPANKQHEWLGVFFYKTTRVASYLRKQEWRKQSMLQQNQLALHFDFCNLMGYIEKNIFF